MAYGDFEDLNRIASTDKVLHDKAFNIAKDPKLFPKKTSFANKSAIKNEIISDKELAEELHKPIIRKFNKRKVHWPFTDNIWGADLSDMQLISRFN